MYQLVIDRRLRVSSLKYKFRISLDGPVQLKLKIHETGDLP